MLKSTNRKSTTPRAGAGSKHGEIEFREDGIFLAQGDENANRIADPIFVTAFETSDPGTNRELAFTEVKFQNRKGKWRKAIVSSSMMVVQPSEFIALLSNRGYMWPSTPTVRSRIVCALSIVKPSRHIRVTSVPGWHGSAFVLPGESYTPDGPTRTKLQIVDNPTVRLGEFRRNGTLGDWKNFIGKRCPLSTRVCLAVASTFAAPNLRMLGLDSFGFNFSGSTSSGKTLGVRLAASAAGLHSDAGPETWDGTVAALEQRALGHRDSIVPYDDISHLQDNARGMVKYITFRLASNRGQRKAGQYVVAQNLVESDWRVIPLSTSEEPLWADLDESGRRRIRGEEVRMINVRACVSDMDDIFDAADAAEVVGQTVEERGRFVEEQERDAKKYQGEAYRAYLAKRTADAGAKATLEAHMADYIAQALLPGQRRWLVRIQRRFAAVYAGAAQAIDYGILPWSKKATLQAIKSCMDDAMEQLIAAAEGADGGRQPSDESLLAEFGRLVNDADFVRLESKRRKNSLMAGRLKRAGGITRPTKTGKVEHLLFGRAFDAWFPDVTVRRRLTGLLRSRGIFKQGRRSDTTTRHVHIAEFGGKVPCYAMSRKRLSSYSPS